MTTELTIEQKIAYVRKALEMGANIEVKFHNCLDKAEAQKVAAELSEMIQIQVVETSYHTTRWFGIRSDYTFDTAIYFDEKEHKEVM